MKHIRLLPLLLVLVLLLTACGGASREPYTYFFQDYTESVTVDPANQTITHEADVYTYTVRSSGSGTVHYEITYPNGATYYWTQADTVSHGGWSEAYDETRYVSGDTLIDAIRENQPREKTGNPFVGILLMGLGVLNVWKPELSFYLRYGWIMENAEPTDAYLAMARFGGVLAAVIGLIMCIV